MKCFIHNNEEAIAVCKNCGKAMCSNCSSYCNHLGICPECLKNGMEEEYKRLIKQIILRIILSLVITVGIIFWMINNFMIFEPFLFLIPLCIGLTLIKLFKSKIIFKEEITKLNIALEQGNKTIL